MFENPQQKNQESLPEVFAQEREMYIPEIGEQLQKERVVEIELNGEHLNVDYRIISLEEKENEDVDPVVLLRTCSQSFMLNYKHKQIKNKECSTQVI